MHVCDTGRGISREELPNLFKMFGKLRRTAAQNSDGIGMGLTICKQLVEANYGTMDVYSDGENMGSRFMFTMRMEAGDDMDPDQMRMSQEEKSLLGTIEKALSVDKDLRKSSSSLMGSEVERSVDSSIADV